MAFTNFWRNPARRERDERRAADPGSYGDARRLLNDRWENSYGGSSSNPFYGEHPLTHAGGSFDSHLFGADNYPRTPWRAEDTDEERFNYPGGTYAAREPTREPTRAAGQFRGRGPRGYRRSDERMKEEVCQCLTDDPHIDASEIDVAVSDCEVVLSGSVHSRAEKRHAEDILERLPGVRDVINGLRVVSDDLSRR
jgi:hypothetical protein